MSVEERARSLAQAWLELDRDPETRAEVESRLRDGQYAFLASALDPASRLTFGTAGLRGEIGAGYNRMSELLITQVAQAMYVYCRDLLGQEELAARGICIGYDGRRKSDDFARITAATFLVKGVRVHLFASYAPTPFVSYATEHLKTALGLMVTASHNPSKDNGYKVYGVNVGVQIVPPHDKKILELLHQASDEVRVPWPGTADRESVIASGQTSGLLTYITTESPVMQSYARDISILKFTPGPHSEEPQFRIGYSAMWGVGYQPLLFLLRSVFGFDDQAISKRFFLFRDEVKVDPEFGGEPRPNPEEAHNMLRLCRKAEEENARGGCPIKLVMATDPDADRIAVAELVHPEAAELKDRWFLYHGNHVGVFLAEWTLHNFTQNPAAKAALAARGDAGKKLYISNSTVSSKALAKIAQAYDARYEECLTGFKWIGTLINKAKQEGYCPVYSYEESIGYTLAGIVQDKDGVCTFGVLAELAIRMYEQESRNLYAYMHEVMTKYGFYTWTNGSIAVKSQDEVSQLFSGLTAECGSRFTDPATGKAYKTSFGRFQVQQVRDCQTPGFDSRVDDHKPNLPVSSSPMITFWCSDDVVCTMRPSGTEPKVKYYVEATAESFEASKAKGEEFLKELLACVQK